LRDEARSVRAFVLVLALAVLPAPVTGVEELDAIRPVRGPITRHFEPPPTPYSAGHRGIDLAVPEGTPVVATEAGVVAFAGQVGGELFVSIDHPAGLRSTYSFLSAVLVSQGQGVVQSQPVARSGACHAGAPDPCLHFGIRRAGEYLDPETFLLAHLRSNLFEIIRLTE
jgi:murein DD-endopeptidase MepM/ murein hydrolase activator NlpD